MLDQWRTDLRLACRRLTRTSAFTCVAVLTLALGLSGVTLMFALVQGVLLRPLPVDDPHRVVVAWKELRTSGFAHYPFGNVEIEEVALASRLFDQVAGVTRNGVGRRVMTGDDVSAYVSDAFVTGGFFEVLGVDPVLGRTFTRDDDRDGAARVIVISHGLWQRRYGGALDVVGRRVTLAAQSYTIAGVMPRGFDYPVGAELWRTTRSVPSDAVQSEVDLIGRLRPGVTLVQATDELTGLTRRLEATASPGVPRGLTPVVRGLGDVVVGDARPAIWALFGAVAILLLIAGANVANLLLIRGESRRQELAVRGALGASRARIMGLFLVESLLLGLAASVLGVLVAWWSLPALLTLAPDRLPRVDSVQIDPSVVVFALGLTLVTTILVGLAPALSMQAELMSPLRGGGRGVTGAVARRGRRALVVAQVALAVIVVAAATLVTRGLVSLQQIDIGVAHDRLVFVELSLQSEYADPARHAQFFDRVVQALEAVPGVAGVTVVNTPPFSDAQGWDVPMFTAEGQTAARAAENPSLNLESIDAGYFTTFDVPLVAGRSFTDADGADTPAVAIVSEDVAARTWPGEDPLGKRLKIGPPDGPREWRTVVGVASATRYRDLDEDRPALYLPAAQFLDTAHLLVLRTTETVDRVATLSRDRVRSVDPAVTVMRVVPFSEMFDRPLARPRFQAFLLAVFGVSALVLATVGQYTVVAAFVRQRDAEIGVRVALGATAVDVRRLVVGEGLRLGGLGAVIGLAGATITTRVLGARLFDLPTAQPTTLAGAAAVLVAASLLASYVPARRAVRVDPARLLRSE
jgi:predicted permease